MTFTEWFIFFLIIQVIHFIGTWKLYVRAGKKSWEASIPIYNAIILMGIINRPKWWVILLFIPIINLLMFPIIWIETCRSFGYNKSKDTILSILTLGFYIYYINYFTNDPYKENRSIKAPTAFDEWLGSISFAIIAATIVHTYFMQPYTIPSSSLEKTLLVGDYLFVSKFHYGARPPMTALSFPMVHDTVPGLGIKSFVSEDDSEKKNNWKNKLSFPYLRLPAIQKIKRNDIVVFNWPGDTTKTMWGDVSGKQTYKPIDKRTNYVKRCVGIPGDSLEVRNGYVYINNKRTVLPDRAKPQWNFEVNTGGREFSRNDIEKYNLQKESRILGNGLYLLNLTDEEAASLEKNRIIKSIKKHIEPKGQYRKSIFPHSPKYPWSSDNFGPIYIPKKGVTVSLNENTIPFYEQIIRRYENNNLTIFENDIYINGKKASTYTFKQDYYWMMGDNRHNSLDARNWGYVPFDHVVGKPVMIWFSFDSDRNKIRWERLFTTVGGSGKPVSYLWLVVILILSYVFYNFRKRKKKRV